MQCTTSDTSTNISSENKVGILKARSENRHEEGGFLVHQCITLRRTKQQMPAKNLEEFLPPPPPTLSIRCKCKYTYNTKQIDGILFPELLTQTVTTRVLSGWISALKQIPGKGWNPYNKIKYFKRRKRKNERNGRKDGRKCICLSHTFMEIYITCSDTKTMLVRWLGSLNL